MLNHFISCDSKFQNETIIISLMLKKMKKLILFFGFVFGTALFASAQSTPIIAKVQVKQTVRIAQGVGNGELTRREAKQLRRQQKHLRKEKRLAKADGVVTRREKKHIRRDQKIANRNIYVQKHDSQSRY